ncbi:hypothetical protein BK634_28275 [Pseudomonas chlororaphis]|nr:hypothetical protein BK634_28275 [Pseudomonas chlororaphis]
MLKNLHAPLWIRPRGYGTIRRLNLPDLWNRATEHTSGSKDAPMPSPLLSARDGQRPVRSARP